MSRDGSEMIFNNREKAINKTLSIAKAQCHDKTEYCSKLLRTLDGTLGDAQAFCWGAIRQLERYWGAGTLSTARDFGLHHVEEHLLFFVAHDAVSHLDLVERLLREINDSCQHDMSSHLSALSSACPAEFRGRLREARNLLAAHRDERVLHWRLTDEHTERSARGYDQLGIQAPKGTMDAEIVGYSPPEGASAQEVTEGMARVGSVGGGLIHLREINECMEEMNEAFQALRRRLSSFNH